METLVNTLEREGTTVGVQWVHGSPARRESETTIDEDGAGMQPEESSDGEWYVVMQRLFQEWMTFISPGSLTSQNLHGKDPYLPIVLYKPLSNIFVKLQSLSRLHNSSVSHVNSNVTSSIVVPSGIVTQPGPRGFILVTPSQVNMVGSFSQYP